MITGESVSLPAPVGNHWFLAKVVMCGMVFPSPSAGRRHGTFRLDVDKRLDLGLTVPRPRTLADATDRPSTKTR